MNAFPVEVKQVIHTSDISEVQMYIDGTNGRWLILAINKCTEKSSDKSGNPVLIDKVYFTIGKI